MSAPDAPKARSGNFLIVGIVLTISILLEQYLIARLFPPLGQLGGIRPMIVFLDIPLPLPNIDWIPVGFLFILLYGMVISSEVNNRGQAPGTLRRQKIRAALAGWWLLLLCILAGGGLYYLVQDLLPKAVRNGIDSFGVRADITLPYPSGELVHLHGSMLLLVFTGFGIRQLLKKTALPPLAVRVAAHVASQKSAASRPGASPAKKASAAAPAASKATPAKAVAAAPAKAAVAAPAKTPIATPAAAPAKGPVTTPAAATAKAGEAAPALSRKTETLEPPRKTSSPPAYRRVPGTVHDQYLTPDPPPDCRLTTPPPVAVILPKPAPRIGGVHPCVVAGMIEPAKT